MRTNFMRSNLPVSVVIPCYNSKSTLERAVNSVAMQSALPIEIIVVDDCSTDGSYELALNLAEKFGHEIKISVLRFEANSGAAAARNAGIKIAEGEFIALLDSDDAWLPTKLEVQIGFMIGHPEIGLTGHLIELASESQVSGKPEFELPNSPGKWIEFSKMMILLRNKFPTPTVVFRKSIGIEFDESLRRCDDHLAWIGCKSKGVRIFLLCFALAHIYKPLIGSQNGLSSSFLLMQLAEMKGYMIGHRKKYYGVVVLLFLLLWSSIKFLRRLFRFSLAKLLTRLRDKETSRS